MQVCLAVDLYSGDRVTDFAAVRAAGVQLVILKASEGRTIRDRSYIERRDRARAAGLQVAAYHFSTVADVQAQIENFLGAVLPDADPTLRLVLDWEDYQGSFLSVENARTFLRALDERTGRRTVIYASASFLEERLGNARDAELGSHPLWIAAYRDSAMPPKPQASWTAPILWQYSGDGVGGWPRTIPGIPGNDAGAIDLNSSPGMTPDQFRAAWLGDTAAADHPHDWAWCQAQLSALGLYTGRIDDDPGPKTEAAVAAFIEKYRPAQGEPA